MANYQTNMVETWRFEEASGTPVGEVTGHTLATIGTAPTVTEGPSITDRSRVIDSSVGYFRINSGSGEPWSLRGEPELSFTYVARVWVETENASAGDRQNQHFFSQDDNLSGIGVKGRWFGNGDGTGDQVLDIANDVPAYVSNGAPVFADTALGEWHTYYGGVDLASGVHFVRTDNSTMYTAAFTDLNNDNLVNFEIGFWSAGSNANYKIQGRIAEFTYWRDRVLTAAEMDDYTNSQAKIPYASLAAWPAPPPFGFDDLSSIANAANVPARTQQNLIPKGPGAGPLSDGHVQVFRTALEIQCETPMVCTVLYRLVREADDR